MSQSCLGANDFWSLYDHWLAICRLPNLAPSLWNCARTKAVEPAEDTAKPGAAQVAHGLAVLRCFQLRKRSMGFALPAPNEAATSIRQPDLTPNSPAKPLLPRHSINLFVLLPCPKMYTAIHSQCIHIDALDSVTRHGIQFPQEKFSHLPPCKRLRGASEKIQ